MAARYLIFEKFYDRDLANEIAERLWQNNIGHMLEDIQNKLDNPFIVKNNVAPEFILKLKSEDFTRADNLLEDFYQSQTSSVDKDYYLFNFTVDQLMDVITKPDEWGGFNYQLAKKF